MRDQGVLSSRAHQHIQHQLNVHTLWWRSCSQSCISLDPSSADAMWTSQSTDMILYEEAAAPQMKSSRDTSWTTELLRPYAY
jgi:hypothetical protein